MGEAEQKKQHFIYLDILRIIAIFLVIYTHSGTIGIQSYQAVSTSLSFWTNLYLMPFSQVSVNLFFMISGALLLAKKEDYKTVFHHRVLRMVLATILAILIQYGYLCMTGEVEFRFSQVLRSFYSGGIITQQWFLYAYISLLLLLPILQKLVTVMEDKDFMLLFLFTAVAEGVLPMWEAVSDWSPFGISLSFSSQVIFFPLMGYFLHVRAKKYLTKCTFLVALFGCILLAAANLAMNWHSLTHGQTIAYMDLFIPVYALCIFGVVEYLFPVSSGRHPKAIRFLKFCSNGVFGTYLIENILGNLYLPVYRTLFGEGCFFPGLLLWMLAVVVTGICITNLLRLIPLFRRIL